MAAAHKMVYVGDDSAYLTSLQAEFLKLYPDSGYRIIHHFSKDKNAIQALHISILKEKPRIVFIDFSKHLDDLLHLARLLVRTNNYQPFVVVGVHDYLSSSGQLREALLAGVQFNYIKSSETFDVVFTAVNLMNPTQIKEHGFATAPCSESSAVSFLCKVGYISSTSIHLETDINFGPGNTLQIKNLWHEKKIILSKAFQVIAQGSNLLFYNFKYFMDANFVFTNPPIYSDTDLPEKTKELKEQFEKDLESSKKKLKEWIQENQSTSERKKVRILVVDENLTLHTEEKRLDKNPYSVRCQPYLLDPVQELKTFQPQIIAFCLKPVLRDRDGYVLAAEKVQNPAPENSIEALEKVIQVLKAKMADKPPFVIIFNSDTMTSVEFQEKFLYQQAMCFPGPFHGDLINKLATKLENKITEEQKNLKEKDPFTIFIKKNSPYSITEIEEEIRIISLSESDLIFTANKEFPPNITLHISTPFEGYITIVQHPKNSKHPQYYAVINGIGEIEKKNLRKFVNTIFFREKDAAKKAEIDAFHALNQKKIEEKAEAERLAAEKKIQEEKEKLEKEAQEKAEVEAKKAAAAKATAEKPKE